MNEVAISSTLTSVRMTLEAAYLTQVFGDKLQKQVKKASQGKVQLPEAIGKAQRWTPRIRPERWSFEKGAALDCHN